VKRCQELLEQIGLERGRVQMFNLSSAMAGQFVEAAEGIFRQISELGPNPLRVVLTQDGSQSEELEDENI
jgi:coenzyme F420-reducing hydrogenase delta subunit